MFSQEIVVQLGVAFDVETVTLDLTLGLAVVTQVSVIFGAAGTELGDMLPKIEFVDKFHEVRADGDTLATVWKRWALRLSS